MCVKCSLVLIDSLLSGLFKQLDLSDASKTFGCWGVPLRVPILAQQPPPSPRRRWMGPLLPAPPPHPPHPRTPGPHWPEHLFSRDTAPWTPSAGQVTRSSWHSWPKGRRPGASCFVPCWKFRYCLGILLVEEHSSYGKLWSDQVKPH